MPNQPESNPELEEGELGVSACADEGITLGGDVTEARTKIGVIVGKPKRLPEGRYVAGSPYWEPGTEPRR